MQFQKSTKIILLNGGSRTRQDFFAGCDDIPHFSYKTKKMIAYIEGVGEPRFYHDNQEVDFFA